MSTSKQQKYSTDKAPPEFKTHGEKMYDAVFNQGINFWANLIISAGFTYWVNHSKVPIFKGSEHFAKAGTTTEHLLKVIKFGGYAIGGGMALDGLIRGKHADGSERKLDSRVNEALSGLALGGIGHMVGNSTQVVRKVFSRRPYEAHKWVQEKIYNAPFMNLFGENMDLAKRATIIENIEKGLVKDKPARMEISKIMTDGLTLTSIGTFIMIPGVWGAEKIKGDFIRWQDRMHYGNDAEKVDWVRQAHEKIDEQKRPTLIGYGFGRLGSMVAVQAAGYAFGHTDKNAIKWVGRKLTIPWVKDFGGTDKAAEIAGEAIGSSVAKVLPKAANEAGNFARRNGMLYSDEQLHLMERVYQNNGHAKDIFTKEEMELAKNIKDGQPYNRAFEDFGKYVGMDTIYTLITAGTIVPLTSWLKQNVPGLSYTQKPSHQEKPQPRVQKTTISRDMAIDAAEVSHGR